MLFDPTRDATDPVFKPARGGAAMCQHVAVIGCGATGVYSLSALLRVPGIRKIVIFESNEMPGPGLPYHPKFNDLGALANIAGVEVPAIVESLNAWAARQPVAKLREWGIEREAGDDRAFFPRIVLGAWLADQLASLVASAGPDKEVEVRTRTEVSDVAALPGGCEVRFVGPDGELTTCVFDRVIVATGYGSNADPDACAEHDAELLTGKSAASTFARRIAILGSSLSAIDAAISIARARGQFVEDGGTVRYRGDRSWHVTMMSRRGLLPEADFWFPQPAGEPIHFTREAAERLVTGADGDLDRLFGLFKRELADRDAGYAKEIDLESATADDFAERYFGLRADCDPIEHAKANLAEAVASHRQQHTICWRFAILQSHEIFGELLSRLSPSDAKRFRDGLKRVFTDNYAAVPHLSIERLLALHDAGLLSVVKLGSDYAIEPMDEGRWRVAAPEFEDHFEAMIDARGQQPAPIDSFPFPTLRLQLCAAAAANGKAWDEGICAADDYTVSQRSRVWRGVHFCALPFLLGERPFVQGLIECYRMAESVANAIAQEEMIEHDIAMQDMMAQLDGVTTVTLGEGAVITL